MEARGEAQQREVNNGQTIDDPSGNPADPVRSARPVDTSQTGTGRNDSPNAPKLRADARVSEPVKKAKLSTRKPMGKRAQTISTKAEADWLKRSFPTVIEGEAGRWDVRPDCAGFGVYFRVDKRQNNGEPINLKFPRISRELFLTWKGMTNDERTKAAAKYVRGHLRDALEQGNDRARIVAGKLRV